MVQSQEAVALSSEQYIGALYRFNVAKAMLARAHRHHRERDHDKEAEDERSAASFIFVGVVVVAILGLGGWFWATAGRETTDDAQVERT